MEISKLYILPHSQPFHQTQNNETEERNTNTFYRVYLSDGMLRFAEEHLIKTNDTIFIVGKILEVIIPDDVLTNDGYVDIEKSGTVTISGLDSYHETKRIARLTYAKPGIEAREM